MSDEQTQDGNNTQQPPTFEAWLESQDDTVKGLLDSHTKGLKTALDSERDARKNFEKQVRDLASKAEAGSEAQQQLTDLANQVETLTRQQAFYDEAHGQGVTNLKLAYIAARESDLIDSRGRINWEQMRESYPQLFGVARSQPSGNAGSGTQTPPASQRTMSDIIRQATGR